MKKNKTFLKNSALFIGLWLAGLTGFALFGFTARYLLKLLFSY